MAIVEAEGLEKRYGEVEALAGLDLEVGEGTILGLLGPNGAGKTTAINILTTLLDPDAGRARVAGIDVLDQPQEVRKRIGLSGQTAAVDEYLTGFENLDMIGRLYRMPPSQSKPRARQLLEQFDLADAADRPVKGYSGGMRRRLDLAGALVAQPPVIFLDEPTTGLDPRSRLQLWGEIQSLVEEGTTLLLTTQYLEEADRLAHHILVIDQGREIALGTPDQLKSQVGGERVEVTVDREEDVERARQILTGIAAGDVQVTDRSLVVPVSQGAAALTRGLRELDAASIDLHDVGLRRPTLDDVFLTLTGHHAERVDEPELEEVVADE